MLEVHLSRRDCHETYLVKVTRYEREIWRSFKIRDIDQAIEVFKALDSFIHKLYKTETRWNDAFSGINLGAGIGCEMI